MWSLLDREGLIDLAEGARDPSATGAWVLTDYGIRFLNFVINSRVDFDWLRNPS